MKFLRATFVAALLTLGFANAAQAAAPALLSVGQQNRHATAAFSAPGAEMATIYLASSPERGTDGRFLEENVKSVDLLTDNEVQHGAWLDSGQIDPGVYYVMVNATSFCYEEPDCTEGFSNVMTLAVPKPLSSYRAQVGPVYRSIRIAYLDLTVRPLGERLPYRVCWTMKSKKRRCVAGSVDGYSWNSSANDSLRISTRGMARRTGFTWYLNGRAVATKTAQT